MSSNNEAGRGHQGRGTGRGRGGRFAAATGRGRSAASRTLTAATAPTPTQNTQNPTTETETGRGLANRRSIPGRGIVTNKTNIPGKLAIGKTRVVNYGGPIRGEPFSNQQAPPVQPQNWYTESILQTQKDNKFQPKLTNFPAPPSATAAASQESTEEDNVLTGNTQAEGNNNNPTAPTGQNPNPATDPLYVPEEEYKFDPILNTEADQADVDLANKATTLQEAIETLEPKALRDNIYELRKTINGATDVYNSKRTAYEKADGTKDYIHNCARIKVSFHAPFTAKQYTDSLQPKFENVSDLLDKANTEYMQSATRIIHAGHKIMCFLLRQDRIAMLETQLIYDLGRFHVSDHRDQTQKESESNNNTHSNIALAIAGVHLLIGKLDLDMLQYLDINRSVWLANFKATYSPPKFEDLDAADQETATFVAHTILGYIKQATCKHTAAKTEKEASLKKKAKMTAEIMEFKHKTATHAVSQAIDQAAIPKNQKTLEDVIINTVQKKFGDLNKKRAATNKTNNRPPKKPKPNGPPKAKAGQKVPPAAAKPKAAPTNKPKGNATGKPTRDSTTQPTNKQRKKNPRTQSKQKK